MMFLDKLVFMALIKCNGCGHMISDKAIKCPKCGSPVGKDNVSRECGRNERNKHERKVLLAKIGLSILLVLLLVLGGIKLYNVLKGERDVIPTDEIVLTGKDTLCVNITDEAEEVDNNIKSTAPYIENLSNVIGKYDNIMLYSDGLACVLIINRRREGVVEFLHGYIDYDGNEVIPCTMSGSSLLSNYSFCEGLAPFDEAEIDKFGRRNNSSARWGFINKKGEVVIPAMYKSADCFKDGLARVSTNDGRILYIDKNNNTKFECSSDCFYIGEGLFNDNGVIKDLNRNTLPLNDKYSNIDYFSDGLSFAYAKDNSEGCYINKKGEAVIRNINYESEYDFNEGLAAVKENGKYGFINKSGKIVIPCTFDCYYENHTQSVHRGGFPSFSDGVCLLKNKDETCYIDKTGKIILSGIDSKYDVSDFSEGLARVCYENHNGVWIFGLMDLKGQMAFCRTPN